MNSGLKFKLVVGFLLLLHMLPGFEREFTSLAKQMFSSCPDVFDIPNKTGRLDIPDNP